MRTHGFTLVELLIVVAIVALLAALILPGLSRAREYAYFTSCKSSLRQMGVGMLVYATDNRGRLPHGNYGCTEYPSSGAHWRVNGHAPIRNSAYFSHVAGRYGLVAQLYGNEPRRYGSNWEESATHKGMISKPRLPGRYLPIEIFWCPIISKRDWRIRIQDSWYADTTDPTPADTAKKRDFITRYCGAFGYALFLASVGCDSNNPDHIVPTAKTPHGATTGAYQEAPHRPMTKSRQPHMYNPPSVWIGADIMVNDASDPGHSGQYAPGHFGARTVSPDFRFNVIHTDGHVHDDHQRDLEFLKMNYWRVIHGSGSYHRVYGWEFENVGPNGTYKTFIDGAFDKNE
jgi:prepilin-type N-terminal cleavage/methylation domain-containing protein